MTSLHCCVSGCTASGGENKVLHHFPNPERAKERFDAWVSAIGGKILAEDNDYVFKYRRVCRRHFEDKFQCRNNKITRNAVPTLHLIDSLSPTRDTSCNR